MNDLIQRINDFKKTIQGNPNDALNQFIQQNQVPQQALDYAQKQASEIIKLFRH